MEPQPNLNEAESRFWQAALRDALFIRAQIEAAEAKQEKAYRLLELYRQYKQDAIRHERQGRRYFWMGAGMFALVFLINFLSVLMR